MKRLWLRRYGIVLFGLLGLFLSLAGCTPTNSSSSSNMRKPSGHQNQEKGDKLMTITLSIDGQNFPVIWEENEAVSTLKKALEKQPLTIHLSAYGGFEQVGELGMTLPSQNTQQTAQPGDIMLYNSSQLVLFYGQNRWSYTKLGHMEADTKAQLAKDKVTVTLTLEENND